MPLLVLVFLGGGVRDFVEVRGLGGVRLAAQPAPVQHSSGHDSLLSVRGAGLVAGPHGKGYADTGRLTIRFTSGISVFAWTARRASPHS